MVGADDIDELLQVFLRVLRLLVDLLLHMKPRVDRRELLLEGFCEGVPAFEGSREAVPQLRASVRGGLNDLPDAVRSRFIRSHTEVLNLVQELLR